jgi:hypothetical protein
LLSSWLLLLIPLGSWLAEGLVLDPLGSWLLALGVSSWLGSWLLALILGLSSLALALNSLQLLALELLIS